MIDSVHELATKAAQVIRERGLRKGGFGGDTGPVCAMGAMYVAYSGVNYDSFYNKPTVPNKPNVITRTQGFFSNVTKNVFGLTIDQWNDAPETTAEDVIRLLESLGKN